ncbi:hypothetical protein NMY22_g4389 [Coprinellus aureogranulatus]|nr:hypothetical protein NMY22_g4389 [Coprinellus aureogranulatus]
MQSSPTMLIRVYPTGLRSEHSRVDGIVDPEEGEGFERANPQNAHSESSAITNPRGHLNETGAYRRLNASKRVKALEQEVTTED